MKNTIMKEITNDQLKDLKIGTHLIVKKENEYIHVVIVNTVIFDDIENIFFLIIRKVENEKVGIVNKVLRIKIGSSNNPIIYLKSDYDHINKLKTGVNRYDVMIPVVFSAYCSVYAKSEKEAISIALNEGFRFENGIDLVSDGDKTSNWSVENMELYEQLTSGNVIHVNDNEANAQINNN